MKKTRHRHRTPKTGVAKREPPKQSTEGIKDPKETKPSKLAFSSAWTKFWSWAGPFVTLFGLWNALSPTLVIMAGTNLDPKETLQTQFVVTNTGHVSIYKIRFACSVGGLGLPKKIVYQAAPALPALEAGKSASRGCFKESQTSDGDYLKVTAWFDWPLIGHLDKTEAYFRVHATSDGFALLPDVAPSPESGVHLIEAPRPVD